MHPSTQHGICTDYCFIMEMKSNCYEVILRLNKPKTMDSSLIITVFLSPMDCFTSSYPYLFKWNVTLYKILLWLKFDEIPSKVCHSPRTYHTQRGSVASIWSKIGRKKEMVKARVSKFTFTNPTNTHVMCVRETPLIFKTIRSYSDSSSVKS